MATTITFDSSVTAATEPSGSGSTSHYFNWANIINNVHENSTINASKQVWYRVSRNSGSIGSGELGYTSGWEALTQIGTTNNYTFDVDVLIDDDAVDETARQGESFTLSIYSHSNQTVLIGSVNFTLYDADFSASSISAASQTIASNATSASVTLTQSQTPEAANPNMFVYNTSTLTGWYPSVGFGTSTTQALTLPSTMLPPAGSTSNYIIRLYNGTAWYLQQPWNFSITRQGTSTGTYGIKVFDTNGTTSVLSPSTRYMVRMTDATSISIASSSSILLSCDMTGLTSSNSDVIFEQFSQATQVPVTRESNGFRVTNNTNGTFNNIIYAVRF